MKDMDTTEQCNLAKEARDSTHQKLLFSEGRVSELADEFTRLEVQITTILFAIVGIFLDPFQTAVEGFSTGAILMKLAFATVIFLLILSLTLGLIHMKRKEKYWSGFIVQRIKRIMKWEEVIHGDATYKEGQAFYDGSKLGEGVGGLSYSPVWTWLLQTISLGLAILILFVIILIVLFN